MLVSCWKSIAKSNHFVTNWKNKKKTQQKNGPRLRRITANIFWQMHLKMQKQSKTGLKTQFNFLSSFSIFYASNCIHFFCIRARNGKTWGNVVYDCILYIFLCCWLTIQNDATQLKCPCSANKRQIQKSSGS